MKLLALDTSTEACSCALSVNGEIRERFQVVRRGHGDLILALIDELMAEAELKPAMLDGLAFGCGPGSFTGVRIGTGVAQGIAWAADIPVAGISSLAALAQQASRNCKQPYLLAAIDARMNEVYWGVFKTAPNGLVQQQAPPTVCSAEDIWTPTPYSENIESSEWTPISSDCYGIGSGWAAWHEALSLRIGNRLAGYDANAYPHATDIVQLGTEVFINGNYGCASTALPLYLRNNVVKVPGKH